MAAQLVAAVKARAVAQGFEGVYLEVSPSNARAAHFYLKQGFTLLDGWAPLERHPSIAVQTLHWAPS